MPDLPAQDRREPGWTLPQRRALLILLSLLFIWLCTQLFQNRQYISDPQPAQGPRAAELASRIDPNTADWQTLAAIPTLGEKRAKAIVAYREHVLAQDGRAVVFESPADLLHVRGIGQATAENLRPYLIFPSDTPSSMP